METFVTYNNDLFLKKTHTKVVSSSKAVSLYADHDVQNPPAPHLNPNNVYG